MRNHPSSLAHQSGVALIAVLLFLFLIMIVGAIAVRQSSVDLNVAASDQVNTLLINNADSVLAHIEVSASGADPAAYRKIMSQREGVLGHFIVQSGGKTGEQVSLCYRSSSDKVFDVNEAHIRKLGASGSAGGKACNPNNKADYSSDRSTVMTQLVVLGLEDQLSDHFDMATRATSEAGGQDGEIVPKVQINGVSVLPSMSNKSSDVIQGCLGLPVGDAKEYKMTENVNDCLRRNNIPSNLVVEEGFVQYIEKAEGEVTKQSCEENSNCAGALANPK